MANRIQIKRKGDQSAPTGLMAGELAWSDNNAVSGSGGAAGFLYIGDLTTGTAVNRKIGGPGWGVELLDDSTLTGVPVAPTVAQADNSTKVATTAYVDLAVANAEPAMNDLSDVTITGASVDNDAHMLIYNHANGEWENKAMSGHVSIAANGATEVTAVGPNAVTLGTNTEGAYVATLAAGDNMVVTGGTAESAALTVQLADNVVIAGTLEVQGMTTTVDSTTVSVADPVFVIGSDTDDSKDRGIMFNWNDTAAGGGSNEGYFGYDSSADAFTFIPKTSSMAGEVAAGTIGDAIFADITGTLQTASQPNITGVGTIGTGVWNGTAVAPLYGGTGGDSSGASGVAVVSTGTWSYESNLDVSLGGTGISTVASGGILLGAGLGNMTVLSPGTEGQMMRVVSGVPDWSNELDGGSW